MTEYLFVYGTLGRNVGHEMHRHLVTHADYAGEGSFNGILYRVAHYPGAVVSSDPADVVHGELYRLRDAHALFAVLDPYDSCGPNDPKPTKYVREVIPARRADGTTVQSWIYLYNRTIAQLTRIASGRFTAP